MLYLELLWQFIQIGLLSFGGGYAVLPLIEQNIVMDKGWMSAQQFVDVLTISEMTPGPIAINAATFVGNSLLGVPGGIVATIGVTLPSLVIVLTLAYLYFRFQGLAMVQGIIQGLRPAVVALIATAGLTILLTAFFGTGSFPVEITNLNVVSVILFSGCIFLIRKYYISPVKVIVLSGLAGFIIYSLL